MSTESKQPLAFINKHLIMLCAALSIVLSLIAALLLFVAPIFHADLGDYAPKDDAENAEFAQSYPELAPYADSNYSVSFNYIEMVKDQEVESKIYDAIKKDDMDALAELLNEPRGDYSAALTIRAIVKFQQDSEAYVEGITAGQDMPLPTFDRHGEYYMNAMNTMATMLIIGLADACVLLLGIIALLVNLVKKKHDYKRLKGNLPLIISALVLFLTIATIVLVSMFHVPLSGMIVLPILISVIAIALPIAAIFVTKSLANKQAAQPEPAEATSDDAPEA